MGRFQKLSWENEVIWDFNFFDTSFTPHHDIEPLPNGNILVICWEVKSAEEAINMGRQEILNEILDTEFKDQCVALDNHSIYETLPIIKNCNISVCNDTGFAHLSSALGVKTITLMADTPLIYGSYSTNMYPIIPDGEKHVTHNTLGKDKINPEKIFNTFISILS